MLLCGIKLQIREMGIVEDGGRACYADYAASVLPGENIRSSSGSSYFDQGCPKERPAEIQEVMYAFRYGNGKVMQFVVFPHDWGIVRALQWHRF
jgi:hypothetical protein